MNDLRRMRLAASGGVAVVAFVVYFLTLAPSLDFIDAGELAAVAHTWGIAHPTGYPLFTIIAGLWSLLPFGSGIFRLNLLAAILSAAAAGIAVQIFFDLLRVRPWRGEKKVKGKKKSATSAKDSVSSATTAAAGGADAEAMVALKASIAAALLLAFGGTYWRTALSIEVYALHILMLALLLWSAVRLLFLPAASPAALRRRMAVTALLLGLSFANHMSTVFVLPALLVLVTAVHWRSEGFATHLAVSVPAFLAGLLPYLYLP